MSFFTVVASVVPPIIDIMGPVVPPIVGIMGSVVPPIVGIMGSVVPPVFGIMGSVVLPAVCVGRICLSVLFLLVILLASPLIKETLIWDSPC